MVWGFLGAGVGLVGLVVVVVGVVLGGGAWGRCTFCCEGAGVLGRSVGGIWWWGWFWRGAGWLGMAGFPGVVEKFKKDMGWLSM